MSTSSAKQDLIEATGRNYNDIIFEEDYIPREIYLYQIGLRNEIIRKRLGSGKVPAILDLGCGTGFHLLELQKHADLLVGTDLSLGALKECRKLYDADFILCDVRHLPFREKTFDVIWIAGLLHHIPHDVGPALCQNIAPSLKSGGLLLIDEPNVGNPANIVNMKLSKADPTGDEFPLSAEKVKRVLWEKSQFTILSCDFYGLLAPLGILSQIHVLQMAFLKFDTLLEGTFLKHVLLRWIIAARRN